MGCTQVTNVSEASARNTLAEEKLLADYFKKSNPNQTNTSKSTSLPTILRQDWSQTKQKIEPKNKIKLLELSNDLLPYLVIACSHDKYKIKEILEQVNSSKLIGNLNEVQYCQWMAQQHHESFGNQRQLWDFIHQIITLCNEKKKFIKASEKNEGQLLYWIDDWYTRFSSVLIVQIASLKQFSKAIASQVGINSSQEKISQYLKTIYTCMLASVRFFEGISWRYSPMLIHERLEKEYSINIRVIFNLLQRVKQQIREDKQMGSLISESLDVQACFIAEPIFQRVSTIEALDKLICMDRDRESEKDLKNFPETSLPKQHQVFLTQHTFRKSYISAKKELDEWLRSQSYRSEKNTTSWAKDYDEISVDIFKQQMHVKELTRSFIRKLKNPDLQLGGSSFVLNKSQKKNQNKKNGQNQNKQDQTESLKPQFEIENSKNILVITGAATDTRVLIESFLQANFKMRSRYKCSVLHCCLRENKLTQDCYYIVKNIMFQIVRTVPAIKQLLMLQNFDFFQEMLTSKFELNKNNHVLQSETPDIFVKFCKILNQIKLDFNIGVFVTGIENLFEQNNFQNFIYIMRSAMIWCPPYLKFVFSAEKRESKNDSYDKALRILASSKIVEISDAKFFEIEAKQFLEFAQEFLTQNDEKENLIGIDQQKKESSFQNQEELTHKLDPNFENFDFVEFALAQANRCYRNVIDITLKLILKNIDLKKPTATQNFFKDYNSDHIVLLPKMEQMLKHNRDFVTVAFNLLTKLQGPISVGLFEILSYSYTHAIKNKKETVNSPQSNVNAQEKQAEEDLQTDKQSIISQMLEEEEKKENLISSDEKKLKENVQETNQVREEFSPTRQEFEEAFNTEVPIEFSMIVDQFLTVFQEFINFNLKHLPHLEENENAWKDVIQFPTNARNWLENKSSAIVDSLITDRKNLNDFDQFFQENMIRDEIIIVARKRKMLKASMTVLNIKRPNFEVDRLITILYLHTMESNRDPNHEKTDVMERKRAIYDQLDVYLRNHIYIHIAKQKFLTSFSIMEFKATFKVANIFKQIISFCSYSRYRDNLMKLVIKAVLSDEHEKGLLMLVQSLYFVEQTLKYDPINFLDFCTQLRGRLLNDQLLKNLPNFCFENLSSQENFALCYFENFHHSLKENPRIDLVTKMPGCQILAIKFLSDKKRVLLSLSNGLMMMLNLNNCTVNKLFINKYAVIDMIKVIDDKYALCSGIDNQLRIWNFDNERQIQKMHVHQYCTTYLLCHKEFIFSYGYDKIIMKYNFMRKEKICWVDVKSHVTALKLINCSEVEMPHKLIVAFLDGDIVLYDMDLNVLCTTTRTSYNEIIRIVSLSPVEVLCFYREGQITVLNTLTLDEVRQGSIFNLKSEDYLDLILIKSREFFLFTIERQKVEFFNAQTFKRSDSWDYFFERQVVGCNKNREGSKICIWDKGGCLILFNFLKIMEPLTKEKFIPSHRRFDPVICIDVTERLDSNQIISCSLDRDLRVWDRSNGVFVKKYDLSSFTAENISAIKLGKTEGMLFLGSKDMNVYLIDVQRGKLCVVYEGHWSRVTSIYTIPGKDILVTLSESNIKIWDLEYDECIKNMNQHSALIIYCAISHHNDQLIVTVSQNLEYKEWNYVTGEVVKSFTIDLQNSLHADTETQTDDDPNFNGEEKLKTDKHNFNLVACNINDNQVAFLALDSSHIIVQNLVLNQVFCVFKSYQSKQRDICQILMHFIQIKPLSALTQLRLRGQIIQ